MNSVIPTICSVILDKHFPFLRFTFSEIKLNLIRAFLAQISCDIHHYHYIQDEAVFYIYISNCRQDLKTIKNVRDHLYS